MHRLVVVAVVLASGCITSSSAHIDLDGTTFQFDAPRYFRVLEVGQWEDWEDVRFQADPPVRARGAGLDAVMDATPGPVREGAIEVGQTMTLCATQGHPRLTISVGSARASFTAEVAPC